MDTHALRALVDAALEAQRVFEASEANMAAARNACDAARDRVKHEMNNLDHTLSGACVIHGDRVMSVVFDTTKSMKLIKSVPLVQFKVVVPPSPPEVEQAATSVKSQLEPARPVTAAPTPPTSGGTIPLLPLKKGPGQR